ncbi:MAG: acyl-CoA dehydrogenase C-terminal domain-containing protein, partial [Pseudomonadales bacterium]
MQLDLGKYAEDADAQKLSELLTPIAKAYLSDKGFEGAVMAQQVFGGHGYIAEWGVEQVVRDARIAQIYEGTNGVQSMDLVGRKVIRDGGATVRKFVELMRASEVHADFQDQLDEALDRLLKTTDSIVARSQEDPLLPGAVATDYMELIGLTSYAWLWGRMAHLAPDDDFGAAKVATAEFFYARLLPRTLGLQAGINAQAAVVMNFADDEF